MADPKLFDPELRKKLFKQATKTPVPFAIGLGKSADDAVLVLHKTHPGKQLFAAIKKEHGLTKAAWGTITVDGRDALFECEKSVPALEKTLKLLLKSEKLPYVPTVTDAGADVEEEAPPAPEPEEPEAELDEDDDRLYSLEMLVSLLKIAKSRGEPLPYAFALGGSPDEHRLLLHKKKKAKQLFAMLRKHYDDVGKGTWGEARVDGRMLFLTVEKPLPSMKRHVLALLKARKLPFKVTILDERGAPIVEEGDEALDADADVAGAVDVDAAGTETAPKASIAPLVAALNKMTPAIKAAVAAAPHRKAEILGAVATAKQQLDAGEADAARASILALGALLKSGSASVDVDAVLEAWQTASEAVDSQISALQAALRGTNDADFERIAEFGLNGITAGHRVKLQTALMDLKAASKDARSAKGAVALGAVKAYRGFLESDEIVNLVDENPFVQTTIRATLDDALAGLEGSLASVA